MYKLSRYFCTIYHVLHELSKIWQSRNAFVYHKYFKQTNLKQTTNILKNIHLRFLSPEHQLRCFSCINSDHNVAVYRISMLLVARFTLHHWVYVGFIVEKVVMEQAFLKLLPFSSISYNSNIRGQGQRLNNKPTQM
jgi:hypothetical protein